MSSTIPLDYEDKSIAIAELERRRKARTLAVTVDDGEIKLQLRSLNQPICLFGEGPADRRERLRTLLSKLGDDAIKRNREEEKVEENKDNQETWYHEGAKRLRDSRFWIAKYSLPRAKKRIDISKLESTKSKTLITAERQEIFKKLQNFDYLGSEPADSRPITNCELSPDNNLIATSSWSGLCKLWSTDLQVLKTFRGHNHNVGSITFHPFSTLSQDRNSINLASCAADGTVNLWSLENEEPIHTIKSHQPNRVSKLKFHPSGRFLATCCFDKSWRLFDLEYNDLEDEILYQEGHSKEVYDIDFNTDGSLAATGGLDSFGRCWDLRTGRCIMFMEGHLKGIRSINFSNDGYHVVTGSEDHSVKIWNLRERKLEYTISAHTNVISKVLFDKDHSNFLLTSSFDGTIRLWTNPGWTIIKTLIGDNSKVMCADIASNNELIISASFDRQIRIWAPEI